MLTILGELHTAAIWQACCPDAQTEASKVMSFSCHAEDSTCRKELLERRRRAVGRQLALPQHEVAAHVDVGAPVRRLGQHRRRPAVPEWHLRLHYG